MAKLTVPNSPTLYYTYYKDLKGVDWSAPETEVSRDHAADILNMIPQDGEYVPIKRKGWREVHKFYSEVVTSFHDAYQNIDYICTRGGVYVYNGSTFRQITTRPIHHIIPFNGEIYLIGNSGIYQVDSGNSSVSPIDIPTAWTVLSRKPDGSGGESYYGVNALTTRRMISFQGDATSTTFMLYPDNAHLCIIQKVEKYEPTNVSANADGYVEIPTYTKLYGSSYRALDANNVASDFTHEKGVVLSEPHPSSTQDGGFGNDSIRITFDELDLSFYVENVRAGYKRLLAEKIYRSEIITVYGAVNMDRLFVVVDNNKIYYTDPSQVGFFADDNFLVAGSSSPIMGLHRKENYLVAVTGDSSNHAIFMIKSNTAVITTTTESSDGSMSTSSTEQQYFSVRPATSGTGAVAKKSFATLIDEPLFLGNTGIFAVTSHALTTDTVVMNRSTFVNPRLTAEPNLESAIATVWKNYYVLCVNNHCYILDSNVITRDNAGNRAYEGYYWDNVPATSFLAYGRELWFGTSDGRWCKFNTDIEDECAYVDDGTFVDNGDTLAYTEDTGTPVTAMYATALDDDKYPQYFKNLNKKGCVITLLPEEESSVEAYYSKDGEAPLFFAKATGATNETIIDQYTLKKVKKYKRLQFIFKNSKAQPFGLIKFTKTWNLGNFAKG